jgi:hypothetical protein
MGTVNSITESQALDIVNYAIAIGIIVNLAVNGGTSTTINVINPNLMALAAQYYGDATQWRTIAYANNLTDPQPIGQFSLVIPTVSGNFT